MKKFLLLGMLSISAINSVQGLESIRLEVIEDEYRKASMMSYELGHGVSTNYSIYSNSFNDLTNDNTEEKIQKLVGNKYKGYSTPTRPLEITEVEKSLLGMYEAFEVATANLPSNNGAGEVVESMAFVLSNIAVRDGNKLGVKLVESQGAFHACKELAWTDYETNEILMTGSCWTE